jgi:hypothetical protein
MSWSRGEAALTARHVCLWHLADMLATFTRPRTGAMQLALVATSQATA